MELTFSIRSDIDRAVAQLEQLRERDFPYIAQLTLNNTMGKVKESLQAEMYKAFDRPTSFTLNALMINPYATKENLTTTLRFKEFAGKGTPAWKYLFPQMYGGERKQKSFEKQLANAGLLPQGMYAVPAEAKGGHAGAPLDQHGNIPGSYIMAMISYLRATRTGDQDRSRTNTRRGATADRKWFVINKAGGALPMGIYERRGGVFNMVIKYVSNTKYDVRYPFGDLATTAAQLWVGPSAQAAAEKALATLQAYGDQWKQNDYE